MDDLWEELLDVEFDEEFEFDEADVEANLLADLAEDRAMLGFLGESYYQHHPEER